MQMHSQNRCAPPQCLSQVFNMRVFSTAVFPQAGFHSAILQIDVFQGRCVPSAFLHFRADVFSTR